MHIVHCTRRSRFVLNRKYIIYGTRNNRQEYVQSQKIEKQNRLKNLGAYDLRSIIILAHY
jgi:hypothetical protein